jgi:putative endonuclease
MGPCATSDLCTWTAPRPERGDRSVLARAAEALAAAHLAAMHGLLPVARNLRVAVEGLRGELDVVMSDQRSGLLVVCEVKARTGASGAGALETLGPRQRARIRRMTAVLLADGTLRAREVRFDLVTLDLPRSRAAGPALLSHLVDAW